MSNKHYGQEDVGLVGEIKNYFIKRQLTMPDTWEALAWANTELGEVYEVLLSQNKKWVRNNPQDHPEQTDEDLAVELGDAIMMLVIAGLSRGVDPIEAMQNKMRLKLQPLQVKDTHTVTVSGKVYILTEEQATELQARFEEKDGN